MLRRILFSILLLVYLPVSLGITIHFHYCFGRLFSTSLEGSKSCFTFSTTSKFKAQSCCLESQVSLGINNFDCKTNSTYSFGKVLHFLDPKLLSFYSGIVRANLEKQFYFGLQSPPELAENLFKKFQNYRI